MERYIDSDKIILLFDRYTVESRCLHESVKQLKADCLAIVIEEDDFLPEDVLSVYDLILGNYNNGVINTGKPRYYNEIPIPENWTINAGVDEGYGRISYQHEDKGRIYYAESGKKYLVKTVEWYDRKGVTRFLDHYNRYGDICARTVCDHEGRQISKSWLSA